MKTNENLEARMKLIAQDSLAKVTRPEDHIELWKTEKGSIMEWSEIHDAHLDNIIRGLEDGRNFSDQGWKLDRAKKEKRRREVEKEFAMVKKANEIGVAKYLHELLDDAKKLEWGRNGKLLR